MNENETVSRKERSSNLDRSMDLFAPGRRERQHVSNALKNGPPDTPACQITFTEKGVRARGRNRQRPRAVLIEEKRGSAIDVRVVDHAIPRMETARSDTTHRFDDL